MRAKLDESMPGEAAEILRSAGWECDTVHAEGLSGAHDQQIADVCRVESRVLVTLDLDFADIRAYPPEAYSGIVVLRLPTPSRDSVMRLLGRALPHQLWIIEPSRIRVRGRELAVD